MNTLSPWKQQIVNLLNDGQWHTRAELIDTAAPLVPEHVALRAGLWRAANPNRQLSGPEKAQIRMFGSRLIATKALHDLERAGRCLHRTDRYRATAKARRAA